MGNDDQADKTKNKKLVQQIFHQGLFLADQSSSSCTMESNNPETYVTPMSSPNTKEWSDPSRKRTRSSPGEKNVAKQLKTDNYWLKPSRTEIPTKNSFDLLEEEEVEVIDQNEKTPKPPPVFVSNVGNVNPLITLLNQVAKNDYYIKVINSEQVKIQPNSSEAYTNIVKNLEEKNTEFHTYKPKQERSFKVVLKNLHYSTEIKDIASELKAIGHETTNIWNIKHRVTKKPLPLFSIELKPAPNNSEVYKIEYLLNCRIKIEAPHFKNEIPQCSNCQRYGHTKSFCHHKSRCVKCAGSHATDQCPRKERSKDVKCVLCEGNHPANYKGCAVYRELQKVSFPAMRKAKPVTANNQIQPRSDQQVTVKQQETASQSAADEQRQNINKPVLQPKSTTSSTTTVKSYANALKDKTKNPAQEPAPCNPNVTSQSSDIQELKQMMKELMDKMGVMLNLLSAIVSQWASKSH